MSTDLSPAIDTWVQDDDIHLHEVTRDTGASCDNVWEVVSNGWTYASWVVGTARIRDVDEAFPAEGSALHHSFGAWPLMLNDQTVVREVQEKRLLVLEARGWPLGKALVRIELTQQGSGSVVSIAEEITDGPGKWLTLEAVRREVIGMRNAETLRRLTYLAEGLADTSTH